VTLAIRALERQQPLSEEAIDSFMEENTFPIQEGTTSTFVYRGEADRVNLRHFIYGLPESRPFTRIAGTDLWYLALELPEGSRVEYKIDVVRNNRHRWIRDPLNILRAHDPFGSNSVCHGFGYETPDWTRQDPAARPGTLEERSIESRAFGETRPVRLYLPPRFRETRRYPLLVVHDGSDYLRYSSLGTVLDNLIFRLEIAPLVVALLDPVDRLVEYADDERHARFVVDELIPQLEATLPLISRSAARGLMGASFGAVASLAAAWRHPGQIGRLLLQSGSFAFTDIGSNRRGPAFEPVVEFVNAFRDAPGRPSERIFVSCGRYESLIYENRSMVPMLQATGMAVRYTEARDGHNWENWRDRLREGISYLFPGPLWMVYE
jgi:enterochelin esterase family protein